MRFIILFLVCFYMSGCAQNKKINLIPSDNIIKSVFYTSKKTETSFKNTFVRNNLNVFDDRTQQLKRVIGVFGYNYDFNNSYYNFYDFEPSPFLINTNIISLERFLILICEDDCLIKVDALNKLISFNMATDLSNVNNPLEQNTFEDVKSDFELVNQNNEQLVEDSFIVANKESNSNDEGVVNELELIKTKDSDVVVQLNSKPIVIKKDDTLLECFQKVADYLNVELINELGNKKWILDSQIDSDAQFIDSDEAILSLIDVLNKNLASNNYGFLLSLKLNNASQMVISYEI